MNTSIGLLHQRRMRRNEQFPLVAINRQLRDLETPTNDEGFETLVVKKDYIQPRDT
jgi:gluconate kinase